MSFCIQQLTEHSYIYL